MAATEEEQGEINEEPIRQKKSARRERNAPNLPEQSPSLVATLSKRRNVKEVKRGEDDREGRAE